MFSISLSRDRGVTGRKGVRASEGSFRMPKYREIDIDISIRGANRFEGNRGSFDRLAMLLGIRRVVSLETTDFTFFYLFFR